MFEQCPDKLHVRREFVAAGVGVDGDFGCGRREVPYAEHGVAVAWADRCRIEADRSTAEV